MGMLRGITPKPRIRRAQYHEELFIYQDRNWSILMLVDGQPTRTVWMEGDTVVMINQPLLPHSFELAKYDNYRATANAITAMVVRGAGAIGATGAYAVAQAAAEAARGASPSDPRLVAADFWRFVEEAAAIIANTRPTAQNLFYGINKVLTSIRDDLRSGGNPQSAAAAAYASAERVADEDSDSCYNIGVHGSSLITQNARVATHCNAGWLAFVDWGSALSPIYAAHEQGKNPFVWVDETRPRGQGSRLTAWELGQNGIEHRVIADNATASLMKEGKVDLVIVGADRIAANGDVANKIGTLPTALAAYKYNVPFYVAAPRATIDMGCLTGDQIPIEERSADEVLYTWGWSDAGEFMRVRTAPMTSDAYNPAFDVTPAAFITGIITEMGIRNPGDLKKYNTK